MTSAPAAEPGLEITGMVHGGQQPVVGAHVYLFAANTTGYGGPGIAASSTNASVSLLDPVSTGNSDSVGAYVTTDANGGFSISGTYSCTPNTQVYLYALGGNPGGGVNPSLGLMAALGNCPTVGNFAASTPFIAVNEVSTVAIAYAFAGFATDATHVSSSGTALARVGIANAFANAASLANLATGVSLGLTPAGNGTVPQAEIDTMANILASCVNSNGAVTGPTAPTACYALFTNALSGGTTGTPPEDTATAVINIAHNPGANVAALYRLMPPAAPFQPVLSMQPNDWTVLLSFAEGNYPGAGMGEGSKGIAIDALGNAWIANQKTNSIMELSASGAVISGPNAFTGGGLNSPGSIAIDTVGNVWATNATGNSVSKFSSSGVPLTGIDGYTGGGLSTPFSISIDGFGGIWAANFGSFPSYAVGVSSVSNSGSVLSGAAGFASGQLTNSKGIAVDGAGDVWVLSNNVAKLSHSGALLSGSGEFMGGGLDGPSAVAIDRFGNAWVANSLGSRISEFSHMGSDLSGSNGYSTTTGSGQSIAIDGAGNVWVGSVSAVTEISSSGVQLSGINGYQNFGQIDDTSSIAIDGSGNVWIVDFGPCIGDCGTLSAGRARVLELVGAGTPVITPITAALPATPTSDGTSNLGTRP